MTTHNTRLGYHGIRFFAGLQVRFEAAEYLSRSCPPTRLGLAKILKQPMMIAMPSQVRALLGYG
jgi:hypothetical protein